MLCFNCSTIMSPTPQTYNVESVGNPAPWCFGTIVASSILLHLITFPKSGSVIGRPFGVKNRFPVREGWQQARHIKKLTNGADEGALFSDTALSRKVSVS